MGFVAIGVCRSGGLAGLLRSIRRAITTNPAAAIRPALQLASGRSARRACATAIGACMFFFAAWAGKINVKRTYRIYKALGLQLRNKTPKRRVKAKLRVDRRDATRPNETWAMDFVHDQLATGRKLRLLTVVDTFSRYSPVIDPRYSYRGEDVVQTPDRIRLLPRLNYKWAAPRSSWYISWTQLSNCGEPTARPIALQARCSAGPVKFTATFWSWAWLFR